MVVFIAGLVIGGLISLLITHIYYAKASETQKKLLDDLSKELKESNTLKYFEFLLENSRWKKELIDNKEIWIAEQDNTFQIEIGESDGEFREPWTQVYPDKNTTGYPAYLKINNTIIKKLTFVSLDGGRIFVPLPGIDSKNGETYYFWDMKSLQIQVCNIIGKYYIHKDLFDIARMSKVEIINENRLTNQST